MSDCLHCDINQLVQERFERGDTDLAEMASMMVESLADLVLLAPESDRSNLMAHALSAFGQIFLEKGGALEGGSNATHSSSAYRLLPAQPSPAPRNRERWLRLAPTLSPSEHPDAHPCREGRPKFFAAFKIV
jgi:hypothetical protein